MDTSKPPPKPDTAVPPESAEYLYDATLIQLDTLRGALVFKVGDATHRVTYPHVSSFNVGAIGRLRLPASGREFSFNTYPDQRLRRAVALDQPVTRRWGWSIGERQFTVEAGVVPGRAGKVIQRDTQPLRLEIPSEFERLCNSRGVAPDRMLSTFIADVCELTNFYGCPREDGYCTSGEESHQLALDYVNRTWGTEEDSSQAQSRRGGNRRPGKHSG
jgi:hypothetical protein